MPSPYTREDAASWLALAQADRARGTGLYLLVVGVHDDRLLGAVGVEIKRRPCHHGELGYWVVAHARGRRVATRGLRLLSDWGLDALALPRLEVHVLPANEPSRAVARNAGFELEGSRLDRFKGEPVECEIYVRQPPAS